MSGPNPSDMPRLEHFTGLGEGAKAQADRLVDTLGSEVVRVEASSPHAVHVSIHRGNLHRVSSPSLDVGALRLAQRLGVKAIPNESLERHALRRVLEGKE